jgi:hypothetical protein
VGGVGGATPFFCFFSPRKISGGAKRRHSSFWFYALSKTYIAIKQREFDIAICGVRSPTQMAKNGKNRLASLTIFYFHRTAVNSQKCCSTFVNCYKTVKASQSEAFTVLAFKIL